MGRLERERNSSVEQKKNRSANTGLFPTVPVTTAEENEVTVPLGPSFPLPQRG